MRRIKIVLLASAATLALASAAQAQSNQVWLDQSGLNQSFDATQSQTGNRVGSSASRFTQSGGNNRFTSNQSGSTNQIGGGATVGLPGATLQGRQTGQRNSATVNQQGTGGRVSLDQQGDDGNNGTFANGTITQGGARSLATVNQTGTFGFFSVDQLNSGQTTINQSGSWNRATVSQGGTNTPLIANGNTVSLRQDGTGGSQTQANDIAVRQNRTVGGANIAGGANSIDFRQSGQANVAGLVQEGSGNVIGLRTSAPNTQSQWGVGHRADVAQAGTFNTLRMFQGGAGTSGNDIIANQSGTGGLFQVNQIDVQQNGSGQSATFGQAGFLNVATVSQASSATGASVISSQTGSVNSVTATQSAAGHGATFTQNGTVNTAVVTQASTNVSTAAFTQSGSTNTARLSQQGSGAHNATVSQAGTNNFVGQAVLSGTPVSPAASLTAPALQNGTIGSTATISQVGNATLFNPNRIYFTQTGIGGHTLSVDQGVTGNGATNGLVVAYQTGQGQSADIDQRGTNQRVFALQDGGAGGLGNTLIVAQGLSNAAAGGNLSNSVQSGTSNTLNVRQN